MRIVLVLAAVVVLAAGCGSKKHQSELYSSSVSRGDSPAGSQAGGPASLVAHGSTVVGKGLLVVRTHGPSVVVRNPDGGTLTLRGKPVGVVHAGEKVSFSGTRAGSTVTVSTLSVTGR